MAFLSQFKVGNTTYDLKDAKSRLALWQLLGGTGTYSDSALDTLLAGKVLGAAAWKAVQSSSELVESGEALPTEGAVKAYVDAQVQTINKFDVQVYTELPSASADTMYILALVAEAGSETGTYVEYITVRTAKGTTPETYDYAWERIGTTETDLEDYVKKTTTIAGISLSANITSASLSSALGLSALAFKDSAEVTGEAEITFESADAVVTQGTVTASGSISVSLKDTASVEANITTGTSSFTPAGTVAITGNVVTNAAIAAATSADTGAVQVAGTVAAPAVYVNLTNDDSTTFVTGAAIKAATWSGSSYSAPSATLASLSYAAATTGSFATAGVTTSVSGEVLVFSDAALAAATTEATKITSWDAGSFDAGSLNFGTFSTEAATTAAKTYVTGLASASAAQPNFTGDWLKVTTTSGSNQLTASFSGIASDYTVVSKVEYTKQAISAATFTGIAASTVGVAVAYSKAASTATVTGTAQ